MYILYRSYVGRVPGNLKRDARPRRHSPKTEEEDYNGLKRGTHDSAQTPNAGMHIQNSTFCCCVPALAKKKMDSTRVCEENSRSL
jgi:hypothetical protein